MKTQFSTYTKSALELIKKGIEKKKKKNIIIPLCKCMVCFVQSWSFYFKSDRI